MVSLDAAARQEGLEIPPNNTLPKGQRKLDDISRLINAARKVETLYRETQSKHQDALIEETRARNDAERRAATAQAKLADAQMEITRLKLALKLQSDDFTQAQRKALMPPSVDDAKLAEVV